MVWPPITMATQHPDNTSVPWWRQDAYIPTQDEIDELLILFKELPIDEYMWDWEGKYVDEAVGEKLFTKASDLFAQRPLGEELHLTYRIPALDGDEMHRMARAFMNILTLADLSAELNLKKPIVTEMFLPLVSEASQPLRVREGFTKVYSYHRTIFHEGKPERYNFGELLEVTPLVEDIDSLFHIERIVRPYWEALLKDRTSLPRGQRIFLARSDPAMNSGLVPAVLAVKAALAFSNVTGQELGIDVYPIIGSGALPFRGSVNPLYVDTFLNQYAGTSTYSIQSGFRYDYTKDCVEKALTRIRSEVPKLPVQPMTVQERDQLSVLAETFESIWRPTIESLADLINNIASFVPPRRERRQHIGLFGYSRGVGKVKLPRAIGFTCALYSLGIPPELIATGRGLREAKQQGLFDLLLKFYPAIKDDLFHAGKYLNRENLKLLANDYPIFEDIQEGVGIIEQSLGLSLGPVKPHHFIHRNLTSTICQRLREGPPSPEAMTRDIVEAGKIRRSLG